MESAALAQFVEFGYHGTSIRRIAQAAEVTVPGLYYRFDSKSEILASLLLEAQRDTVARHDAALGSVADDPRARFVVQVENTALHTIYRQAAAFLSREIRYLPEKPRAEIMALRHYLERSLCEDIERGVAAGVFSTTHPRRVGRAVLVLCRGISGWYRPTGPLTPEQITSEYVGYALKLVGADG